MQNKKGWAKYLAGDLDFAGRFSFTESAIYSGMNSIIELSTAG